MKEFELDLGAGNKLFLTLWELTDTPNVMDFEVTGDTECGCRKESISVELNLLELKEVKIFIDEALKNEKI